jgi:hypothetical protein
LLYEDKNTVLSDVFNLSQFFYDNKLITIIGEFHEHTKICKPTDNVIKIEDYCFTELTNNPSSNVLLEYSHKEQNPGVIRSNVLQNIYNKCKHTNRIIPSDYRQDILSFQHQGDLYIHPQFQEAFYPERMLIESFTKPFLSKKDEYFIFLNESNYSKEVFAILNIQKEELIREIQEIHNELLLRLRRKEHITDFQRKNYSITTREKLKPIYQKIGDIKILDFILDKNRNVNEFIVVVGNNHYKFISYILEQIVNIDKTNGKILINSNPTYDCVSLYHSYVWND